MTSMILSSSDFKRGVELNIYNMGLQDILHIDDSYIKRTFDAWVSTKMADDYRAYVSMLLTLPDNIQFVDTHQLIFKIARKLGHNLVVQLAESFYYEDNRTVVGEQLVTKPFDRNKIDNLELAYFFDIIDTIYDRVDCESESTLGLIRSAFQNDDYLANIFSREKL